MSRASIWTAAACGDVDGARLHLDDVDAEGGPFRWSPLLYLTYSRLGGGDALGVARLLLDHGADPNAGYLWEGLVPPFTALTGAYGGGEQGAPPHPDELDLAELLLDAGADPNDHQTIYNRGLGGPVADDTAWLEQLLRHGLGRGDGGPWKERLGDDLPTPAELLGEALQSAVEQGCVQRARVLLAAGADPNGRGQHPGFCGRTAMQGAARAGDPRLVDLLVGAGGRIDDVDDLDVARGRLLAGLDVDAALVAAVRERDPDLVAVAAELGRADALASLVDLGFDVNHRRRTTALHAAAWRDDADAIHALLALGADASVEDEEHHATPLGWARFGGHERAIAALSTVEG